jgi:predicted peroxiredoxin
MNKKLLIILANSDPENPEEFSAPLFQAMVAAAMSHKVEVIFTGLSAVLAIDGHAESVLLNAQGYRTVYDLIRGAHKAGTAFKVCTPALEMWGKELITEIDESIGAAYIIEEAMSDDTVTFTY